MARAALGVSLETLATDAGVHRNTIWNLENDRGSAGGAAVEKLRTYLESVGVIFIEENGEGPGVRLRKGQAPLA